MIQDILLGGIIGIVIGAVILVWWDIAGFEIWRKIRLGRRNEK